MAWEGRATGDRHLPQRALTHSSFPAGLCSSQRLGGSRCFHLAPSGLPMSPPACVPFPTPAVPPPQERTYIMIKPDGVQRNLIAPILERFLAKVRESPSTASRAQHRAGTAWQSCIATCPLDDLAAGLHPSRPQVFDGLQVAGGDPLCGPQFQALLWGCAAWSSTF